MSDGEAYGPRAVAMGKLLVVSILNNRPPDPEQSIMEDQFLNLQALACRLALKDTEVTKALGASIVESPAETY